MKKLSKKQKLIGFIAILIVAIIIATVIKTSIIKNNNQVANEGYLEKTANSDSEIIANYIKKGITIGGVTGKLESLNTFDATATEEDIIWGKTGYVKGKKITGTKIVTIAQAQEAKVFFQNNKNLIDDLDNTVVVPSGFKIAEDSATAVEDGIVIEDKDGNQFVWIPAKTGLGVTVHTTKGDKTIVYSRTAYSTNVATGETDSGTNSEKINYSNSVSNYFTEALPTDEETSVNANGGYYIGRFEAGDEESTEAKTMRTGTTEARTITIKKDQVPYNYITQADCKTLSEGMSSVQGYKAKSKLLSSYAWDTAVSFIQITNEDYGNSSNEGNYKDTTFNYTDIIGEKLTKSNNSITLVPTGQTTKVCNIYDMGGNLWEYTTEKYSNDSYPYTNRGGIYDNGYATFPSGYRVGADGRADIYYCFRIAIFL